MRGMLLLAACLAGVAQADSAGIYRWTDASGAVHFGDQPTPGAQTLRAPAATPAPAPAPAASSAPPDPAPPPADETAASTVEESFNYYPVSARRREDLARNLLAATPARDNGQPFVGYTHWDLHYHYWTAVAGGLCRVARLNTQLHITYTLPQLSPSAPEVKNAFARYYTHLWEHERGHGDHGRQAARVLEGLMWKAASPDCRAVGTAIQRSFDEIVDRYRQIDQDYDTQTRHGATQGATLESLMQD